MREGIGADPGGRWLAAVLLFFCLPLFVWLGREDLQNDEAIYSFAVDRLVATGDWLLPKALPHDDLPFFEKPPLKFWIVAAPIAAGLLPDNEFGHRFWDAGFGAAAFVYVFLLGRRLLNPMCGFFSVLILFAHSPLVFTHGLRSNNMESALVLAYCGGVFHYLRWADGSRPAAPPDGRRSGQIAAVVFYFVLAFMTKFVAALFLPLVLGLAAASVPAHRRLLRRDWGRWAAASLLGLAAIAPWFVFMSNRFGARFWREIVGVHVFQRLTATLDPGHLQPWNYYLLQMVAFWETGALVLMAAGLLVLATWTAPRINRDAIVIVLWFVVPTAIISAATSKLYHYVYPFLPGLALAGGYLAALVATLGRAPIDRGLERLNAALGSRGAAIAAFLRRPPARALLVLAIAASIGLAIGSLVSGRVLITVAGIEFASAGVLRPGLAVLFFALLFQLPRRARPLLPAVLVVSLLPLQGYRDSLMLLGAGPHPRRSVSRCILAVQASTSALPRGLGVNLSDDAISQSIFYYFEKVKPWHRQPAGGLLPVLTDRRHADAEAAADLGDGAAVLLPGPYADCGGDAAGA